MIWPTGVHLDYHADLVQRHRWVVEELTARELGEMEGIVRHLGHVPMVVTSAGCVTVRNAGYRDDARQSGAGSGGSEASPAARIPSIAQYSSRSEVSPLTPTAPMARPSRSRMSTPPGTGMNCPREAVATALWNAGRFSSRSRMVREGMPMPRAPSA